jgi:CubicO group peptidase (beta-lactamase class C family)
MIGGLRIGGLRIGGAGSKAVSRWPAALVAACLALAGASATAEPPERDHWPTEGWRTIAPEEAGVDPIALMRLELYAFPPGRDDAERRGVRTDGLVVVRDGALVYERYAGGYGPDTPHLSWSVTKSLVQTLYGVALAAGLLEAEDLGEPIADGRLGREDWGGMTPNHLLWMASGIAFDETYEDSPLDSSVMAMLYGAGSADMADYVAGLPFREPGDEHCREVAPGACFTYSSGDSNLLMALLRERFEDAAGYRAFPWEGLFEVVGMDSAVFETDGAGTFVGSSYLYATPRDLAKWGFLYLNDGVWEGRRLLPEGWTEAAATPNPAFLATCPPGADPPLRRCVLDPHYGAHWWTNRGAPERGLAPFWPELPGDLYFAWGHWGQKVYVIPSWDMVVVRTADDRDAAFDDREFLTLLRAAFAGGPA